MTLALLQAYVPHQGDAWHYTLDGLGRYYERALAGAAPPPRVRTLAEILDDGSVEPDGVPEARELIDTYIESARLLGLRTAEFHLALASAPEVPDFAPELSTTLYLRSQYQSLRSLARQTLALLRRRLPELSEGVLDPDNLADAQRLLEHEDELLRQARRFYEQGLTVPRTRYHGDYHLGHLLFTGKDFVLLDVGGDASRHLVDRRRKRSPLRDVASMFWSFHFAAAAAGHKVARDEDRAAVVGWGRFWRSEVAAAFVQSYLASAGAASFLPASRRDLTELIRFYLLKRGAAELRGDLLRNPGRVGVWVRALLLLIELGNEREKNQAPPQGEGAAPG
jgi:maltose alpha-D-glucosyltransferase/alpha-amylase